jgi:hypothetical protein
MILFGGGGLILPLFGYQFNIFRGHSTAFIMIVSAVILVAGIIIGVVSKGRN